MFNVRDLMANLQATQAGAQLYRPCAWTGGCWVCTGTCYDTCGFGTWGCTFSVGCGASTIYQLAAAADPATATQQLGALKEQLKQALAEVEKHEREALERK
jgi:hypothetical protein